VELANVAYLEYYQCMMLEALASLYTDLLLYKSAKF